MALKGDAKKLYQRNYMREYMRKHRLLRPNVKTQTIPPSYIDADGNPVYD